MSGSEALGRRAVACAAWRWMSGMLATDHGRIVSANEREPGFEGAEWLDYWDGHERDCVRAKHLLPDFDDPATRGCLLELVREGWGEPFMGTLYLPDGDDPPWTVSTPNERSRGEGTTEAEALVTALEAAP